MKRLTPDQKAGIYITVSVHLAVIIVLLLIRIGQEIQRENSFVLDFTQQEEMERKQEEARLHEMTGAQLEELIAAAQSVPVRNVPTAVLPFFPGAWTAARPPTFPFRHTAATEPEKWW